MYVAEINNRNLFTWCTSSSVLAVLVNILDRASQASPTISRLVFMACFIPAMQSV